MTDRKVHHGLGTILLTWLCLPSATSLAQADLPRRPALHWSRGEAAESCIDPRTLAERVEAWTGPVLVAPAESDLSIEGHIDARPEGGFRARITVTREAGAPVGDRILEEQSSDCRAIDAALAFVIALTIDPTMTLPSESFDANLQGIAPEEALLAELDNKPARPLPIFGPLVAPIARSKPTPTMPKAGVSPKPPSRARTHRYEVGIAAALDANTLPSSAWGAIALGSYRTDEFGLAVEARGVAAPEALRVDAVRSVRMHVLGASMLACIPILSFQRLKMDGCAGPALSFLRARGVGFSTPKRAVLKQYTGVLGAIVSIPILGPLAFDVRAQGLINFNRGTLTYERVDETPEVFTTSRLSFLASSGASYVF